MIAIETFLHASGGFQMDEELQKIGSRVKAARLAKHMTQMQLAEAADISVSFLSNIENGRQSMNLRALIAISDADATRITEEIGVELASFTLKEREAMLQIVQLMKQTKEERDGTQGK